MNNQEEYNKWQNRNPQWTPEQRANMMLAEAFAKARSMGPTTEQQRFPERFDENGNYKGAGQ